MSRVDQARMFSKNSIYVLVIFMCKINLFLYFICMRGIGSLPAAVNKVLVCINLMLWVGVLIKSATKAYHFDIFKQSDLTDDIKTFRFALGFQIFTSAIQMTSYRSTLLLITSTIKLLLQILTCWYFLEPATDHYTYIFMAIVWSAWESALKVSALVTQPELRELLGNLFFIMNPLQTYTMVQVIRNYQQRNKETLSENENVFSWGCCVAVVLYKLYTYVKLCRNRIKSYENERIMKSGKGQ